MESLNPKTAEATLEETEKRGSLSRDLTSLPLGTFFGFTLPYALLLSLFI